MKEIGKITKVNSERESNNIEITKIKGIQFYELQYIVINKIKR